MYDINVRAHADSFGQLSSRLIAAFSNAAYAELQSKTNVEVIFFFLEALGKVGDIAESQAHKKRRETE